MNQLAALDHDRKHILDDAFVLGERPLREGANLDQTARFRDQQWPLTPAVLQQHVEAMVLDFRIFPARYELAAKEFCYALLSGELPPGERRLSVSTIRGTFFGIAAFFRWLDDRAWLDDCDARSGRRRRTLAELTAKDLADYHRHLRATYPGRAARARHRSAVRYLYRYRQCLHTDRLLLDPRGVVDEWDEGGAGYSPENATDRIPEAVHGPLLAWALRFVDDFAPDIIAADKRWRELRQRRPARRRRQAPADLRAMLDEHLRTGRPLPGRDGKVNKYFLAHTLSCSRQTLDRHQNQIDAAAAVVGISDHTSFDIAITGRLDEHPWINEIVTEHRADNGLAVLARMLYAACYITIAFLSGMRDSEVKHLRRGCLRVERDSDGRPYRWKLDGLAFKGEKDPRGVAATWVIGEPAARAVSVLERLQPNDVDLLFTTLNHGPGSKATAPNTVLGVGTTIEQLNAFVVWVNDRCRELGRNDVIPPVNGRPWRLTSRQFRRTLAWFIARRPGGSIAGAIAYRHHAVQLFEGYAGTSDSGFRAEVEAEQALVRGENLLAMIDQHQHTALSGPAKEEAEHRLDQFGNRATYAGSVVTDAQRLKRIMRRHDPAVYPGAFVTCVFDPDKALCLRQGTLRDTEPVLANCRPLDCHNVALSPDNLDTWRGELANLDNYLARASVIPPLLAHRLQDRRREIANFIERHSETEQP